MREVHRFRVALATFVISLAGCGIEQIESLPQARRDAEAAIGTKPTTFVAARPNDSIRIGSFNIQVFGVSKMEKPEVMQVLTDVARRFDVLAIQELRAADQQVIPQFVAMINADGARYDFVVGPRLGRTSSKEQYVFLFDTTRVELVSGSVYTVNDPDDWLHREPLVASFRVRTPVPSEAFTFTLINIHTDPDETDQELAALGEVFPLVQQQPPYEDDVILLGDLNVDERHLGRLGQLPGIRWTVSGEATNTRGDKSYDNVVFDGRTTTEFTGRAGVMHLQSEYGLTLEQALGVSDHQPVWAEFSAIEDRGSRVAGRPLESNAR